MKLKTLHKTILISALFAIAMAYLESAVVVYLRELYYPFGFDLTLAEIPDRIYFTEIGRELATILMLYAFASSVGKNGREIFAYFSFNFGLWDIWYYIWLKVLIDWPATLFDGDVLFLIPLPWVGPVLAPVLISIALVFAAYLILRFEQLNKPIKLTKCDWGLEILSAIILILSFIIPVPSLNNMMLEDYPWWLFVLGLMLGLFIFGRRVLTAYRQI